ncbi:uncharacterized protein BO96DRAFT_467510 [Aspergillus niger CBS 101883]|uniref:Contig An08c0220, genomic contig n=2 Tax=Aspergillus niger TaxID=5061 RepID=A2QS63_ASPNC|nr:uncharacterized protein BO96DRAFT_467510 [Aspergillus niger CBS 101883]XP_059601243.1 uncharacterized protein An08g08460 [Aspergillus niger]PYH54620.1 hypothetical protein BO96DRAFT_467510 [Aspergillus niger CBS 101883]CAK40047.1 unnamed protein product [Aspergillus niger]
MSANCNILGRLQPSHLLLPSFLQDITSLALLFSAFSTCVLIASEDGINPWELEELACDSLLERAFRITPDNRYLMLHGQWHMVTIRISRQRCILSSRADWDTMRISLAWAALERLRKARGSAMNSVRQAGLKLTAKISEQVHSAYGPVAGIGGAETNDGRPGELLHSSRMALKTALFVGSVRMLRRPERGRAVITESGECLPLAVGLPPLLGSDDVKMAELQSIL